MPDETVESVVEETNTDAAVEPKATDFLNEDGTFKEGWLGALVPEDLRDRKVYKTTPDIRSALKLLAHQEKFLGSQGKGIMPLGEKPTPTDLEMYRKAMGIPETPDGYKVEVPEGLGDYYDETVMKETVKGLHALHLTPAQVSGVMALEAGRLRAGIKEQEESEANAHKETETVLREDWGEKFEENLRLANRVIAENVAEEDKDEILALIGNNVKVSKLFAKLGEAYLEDRSVNTDGERPSGIQSEIEKLEATPGYADGKLRQTNRKEHDRILARLQQLYKRRFPEGSPAATA